MISIQLALAEHLAILGRGDHLQWRRLKILSGKPANSCTGVCIVSGNQRLNIGFQTAIVDVYCDPFAASR